MGRAERIARRRRRRRRRRERREERRENIKAGLKKMGRATAMVLGGPVAAGGAAVRARRQGAGRAEAAGGFFRDLNPGKMVRDTIEGSAAVAGGTVEAVTGDRRIGDAVEAAGSLPGRVMGTEHDVMVDGVRTARSVAAPGLTAKARLEMVHDAVLAPAAQVGGETLSGLSEFARSRGKPVTASISADIHRVFGDSLDLSEVLVIEDEPVLGYLGRSAEVATTAPRLIWLGDDGFMVMKSGSLPVELPQLSPDERARFGAPQHRATPVMIHELVHRWQYEHSGSDYTVKALRQQAEHGDDAYNWQRVWAQYGDNWLGWPEEAGAAFIQAAHSSSVFLTPSFDGTTLNPESVATWSNVSGVDATDLHRLLQTALRQIWAGRAAG